jgi:hypothetical protein
MIIRDGKHEAVYPGSHLRTSHEKTEKCSRDIPIYEMDFGACEQHLHEPGPGIDTTRQAK